MIKSLYKKKTKPLPRPENDPRLIATAAPGSRSWIVGSQGDDGYKTEVGYRCTDGSKFDTTGNGDGDTDQLITTCKWRKSWEPWGDPSSVPTAQSSVLPPCIITHCISPPPIPAARFYCGCCCCCCCCCCCTASALHPYLLPASWRR